MVNLIVIQTFILAIAFDSNNTLYIADLANSTVYIRQEGKLNLETKVKDYEGNPFKGPCSIAINKENDVLYICDSGYFGSTCLNRPYASLYILELDSNNICIKPMLLNCLAYASDIVYDYNRSCLYVAETFENRIIRLEQNPIGVYNTTHFYQFSGRIGPTALSIDNNGYLFVARFEFQNKDEVDGIINVINPDGSLVGELILSKMPEITGLLISVDKTDFLYVTEKCSNSIIRLKISQFMQEVLLSEENNRNIS